MAIENINTAATAMGSSPVSAAASTSSPCACTNPTSPTINIETAGTGKEAGMEIVGVKKIAKQRDFANIRRFSD
ncbi:MAG: hypothetical protein ACJAXW_002682 [Candidatus Azotimanducaceae bacterium]